MVVVEKVTLSAVCYGDRLESQGTLGTDKLFTGQRLDDTGLYYYGARYYDPTIGRFISADTFVPWSTGVDVVSLSLTVNTISAGLGSLNVPQGNYPSFTFQAPVNPQNLNRYSYVLNNPLRYTDPFGWWTLGFGFNINVGMGRGWSVSMMVVIDGHGNYATAVTKGNGNFYGCGASIMPQYQWTNADRVTQLSGKSNAIGGSVTLGPSSPETFFTVNAPALSAGGESIIGKDYKGININAIGIGASIMPFETHGFEEETEIEIIGRIDLPFVGNSGSSSQMISDPLPTPMNVGGGFYNWGTTSSGTQVISMNDPSTYSWWDWYGW